MIKTARDISILAQYTAKIRKRKEEEEVGSHPALCTY